MMHKDQLFPAISWPTLPQHVDQIQFPNITRATLAGITVAIAGNVLISLALNCQKLAHRRLECEREAECALEADKHRTPKRSIDRDVFRDAEDDGGTNTTTPVELRPSAHRPQEHDDSARPDSIDSVIPGVAFLETQPLLPPSSSTLSSTYGSNASDVTTIGRGSGQRKRGMLPRFWHKRSPDVARGTDHAHASATHAMLPVDVVPVYRTSKKDGRASPSGPKENVIHNGNEADYLKSKLWYVLPPHSDRRSPG